ncbi:MAG: grasp-with-spasm system SPASM domain peptide maturase [Flavobacteriales bacterium]|nr:grasp-with-spasm system SPASM domain peptide maturase [Flavobacteriales bacterium]
MKDEVQKGFRLFACCVPVKGAVRAIVCDLQRSEYVFISNELFEEITDGRFLSSNDIQRISQKPNGVKLLEQLKVLESREYGFWCTEEESRVFPQMQFQWESPSPVTHAIIDSDSNSRHPFEYILKQLSELNCQALQLRFFEMIPTVEIETILGHAQSEGFTDVELIIANIGHENTQIGRVLSRKFPALVKIIIHSAYSNQLLSNEREECPVYQITNRITSSDHCGFIHPDGFVVNRDLFSEAKHFNSCLNGKISVDVHGNIKNCPSMGHSFGNAHSTRFDSILKIEEFKRFGKMTKDQILVCKDCEFRYICTDCRAFVSDVDDDLSKPLRCSYDPYLAKWEND